MGFSSCSCRQKLFNMSIKILFVGLFLLGVSQCINSSSAHYPTGKNRPCCVEVTMKNLTSRVIGNQYYQQRRRSYCVEALIFNTNEGQVCVNPQASWAKLLTTNMTRVR